MLLWGSIWRKGRMRLTEKEKKIDSEQENEELEENQATPKIEETSDSEVSELKQKLEELEDQNLRLQAEIQNMSRRNKKEREAAVRYRSQDLGKEMLPVLDNLERALDTEVSDEAGKSLKQGLEMVLDSFYRALASAGIEEIKAEGEPFDPNFHEAYAQVPAEEGQESGHVAQVYEKGYKLHDRVLRAAKVTVTE